MRPKRILIKLMKATFSLIIRKEINLMAFPSNSQDHCIVQHLHIAASMTIKMMLEKIKLWRDQINKRLKNSFTFSFLEPFVSLSNDGCSKWSLCDFVTWVLTFVLLTSVLLWLKCHLLSRSPFRKRDSIPRIPLFKFRVTLLILKALCVFVSFLHAWRTMWKAQLDRVHRQVWIFFK